MQANEKPDRLEKMLALQREFHEAVGPSLKTTSEAQCELMIVESMRNLIFEAVEVTQELNYKSWKKTRKDVDWPAVKEELADCYIFLMNAILESGMDSQGFYEAVMRKVHKNVERQKNNY